MKAEWVVYKFGGTSVADADCYRNVSRIVSQEDAGTKKAVVVSAMAGVTNTLLDLVRRAASGDTTLPAATALLRDRHLETLRSLVPGPDHLPVAEVIAKDIMDLEDILKAVTLTHSASEEISELVAGYGEQWSARILNAYLRSQSAESRYLDARQVLVVEHARNNVFVDWEVSKERLQAWLKDAPAQILAITGYIAATRTGVSTTLKRNGSDFSASIFGSLLEASSITIWKEVDGVLSADPRLVPDAVLLPELSYSEATELAYFGAKVVHPNTMLPAMRSRIPVRIRNSFAPDRPGTLIHARPAPGSAVKGFATIDDMALVNVEGTGMLGVPGVTERLFGGLREVGVSVVMISQASSEQSICFAVPGAQAELTRRTVESTFATEISEGLVQKVDVIEGTSVLAAVGDSMAHMPGIAGKFFTALARSGVNIRAIAQGSSERNISAAIDSADAKRALRAVHSAFYLSNQTLSIGIIGPGLIGGAFLGQLNRQLEWLRRERKIDLRVRAIANSRQMLLDDQHIDLSSWKERLAGSSAPTDLGVFADFVQAPYLPHAVIIDATSSPDIAQRYPAWLKKGIHVITPNKKANTGSMAFYRELKQTGRASNKYYLYETTVGAGLPIIHTLRELVETGDRVLQVEGVLSGTLSYLFNSFTGEKPFSAIVTEAMKLGYTEPDPRDDLSGMDVARKLVILAREIGLNIEVSDIQVRNLVPEALRQGSIQDFLKDLPKFDGEMSAMLEKARANDQVLRYVGMITSEGKGTVDIQAYPRSHAFAGLQGSDNIIAFTTERYKSQPLIVRGPGAGPEVTAAGVFGDLLKLASHLGAPQ